MSLSRLTGIILCVSLLSALGTTVAHAAPTNSFTVEKIEVIGLQRISKETVLTYMPNISVGQTVNAGDISTAIHNLYGTGFFSRVQFRRSGSVLFIVVKERPTIATVQLIGNKAIDTDALKKGLQQAGLTSGRFFSRSALDQITGSLVQTYFGHGRYAVEIDPEVEKLKNNRVRIKLNIKEGDAAKVLSINFTGNHDFDNGTLRDQFKLNTPGWFSWLTHNDRYEEEKLNSSLEALRSFYMNRGYADFHINSVQVQLAPNRSGIYITTNLHEGGKYKVGGVKLLGKFPIKEKLMEERIFIKKGSTFSMKVATAQADLFTNLLGVYGYGFAKVSPLPKPDPKTHKVELVFYVDPGPRVYVRHIHFNGAQGTDDKVFRRNMRQAEGTWLNNLKIKRSRIRIQRLPFVKDVDIKPKKVPGTEDQVDVDADITTRQSGTANVMLGYSGYYGLTLGGEIALSNFLGEGKILRINASKNRVYTNASIALTEPYATVNGVSRTERLFYEQGNRFNVNTSSFLTRNFGGSVSYGFPLSEFDSYSLGATYRHGMLTPYCNSPDEFKRFTGDPANGHVSYDNSFCTGLDPTLPVNVQLPTLTYNNIIGTIGFTHDTRNRTVLPTQGTLQQWQLQVALPIGSQTYYRATWNQFTFIPIGAGFIYGLNSEIGVGHQYGKTSTLPPYAHFYTGGPDSVAGYKAGTLTPLDSNGLSYGGGLTTWMRNELILPNFLGHANSYRAAFFIDAGNVFAEPGDFKTSDIRASYGLSLTWLTPLGAMRFSYAIPFHDQPGDQTERLQFSLGSYF